MMYNVSLLYSAQCIIYNNKCIYIYIYVYTYTDIHMLCNISPSTTNASTAPKVIADQMTPLMTSLLFGNFEVLFAGKCVGGGGGRVVKLYRGPGLKRI